MQHDEMARNLGAGWRVDVLPVCVGDCAVGDSPLTREVVLIRDALASVSERLNAGERSTTLRYVEGQLRDAANALYAYEKGGAK